MKKIILSMLIASFTLGNLMAQKEVKYEKLYYKNTKVETSDFVIEIDNAVSTAGETKFKLKITNKTGDYIMYKPEESKFIIAGKEQKIKEKSKIIDPNDYATWVINLKGAGYNSVKNYTFEFDGLYKISSTPPVVAAPDFKLPASQNDFTAGGFKGTLSKLYKESDKTEAKFDIAYNGDKIGFIMPSKAAVKMPDGNDYANADTKAKPILLMKGEKESVKLQWDRMQGGKAMDMQKVEMIIKWNATFGEVLPEKIKPVKADLEFDEATSNEKGK